MPTFSYVARDQLGAAQIGQLDAANEDEVIGVLQQRGLLVTSVAAKGAAGGVRAVSKRSALRMHQRVTIDDQVLMCEELSTLLEAGVPLLRSLEVVSAQVESRTLLWTLEQVHRDVGAGSSLRAAISRHPAVFSKIWLNMVETGEASGRLAETFHHLADHLEQVRHLQNEAKTALTYPAFLLVVAVVVLAIFVFWLIPKFTKIFETYMGSAQLPMLTRMVIGFCTAARRYFFLFLGAFIGGLFLLRRYVRTDAGQWMRDRIVLRLPLFQTLFTHLQLAEFSRGLATLLEAGVPLLSTLEILESSASNKLYAQAIGSIRQQVREGKSMAAPMEATGMFPAIVVQMIQVGEEIGEMAKMSSRIAKYYEERVETFIARMTRLFEPVAIIIIAGLVLFVVLAIFLPIFQMTTGTGLKA